MTDASAGWRTEYHYASVSPTIEGPTCEIGACSETFGLQTVQTTEGAKLVCRRHAKHLLGVSS